MQRILPAIKIMIGVLLTIGTITACGNQSSHKNKTKEQLIADAESLIDRMSIEEISIILKGSPPKDATVKEVREQVKKLVREAVEYIKKKAKENIREAEDSIKDSREKSKALQGKPKKLTDIMNNIGQKIIQEAAQ